MLSSSGDTYDDTEIARPGGSVDSYSPLFLAWKISTAILSVHVLAWVVRLDFYLSRQAPRRWLDFFGWMSNLSGGHYDAIVGTLCGATSSCPTTCSTTTGR